MYLVRNGDPAFPPAKMALEDGTVVTGQGFGHTGETGGGLCFNTSMTGYQESSSDPSYHGQIMMMTCPHIGNAGDSNDDMESARPIIVALVVRFVAGRCLYDHASASVD